MPDFLPPPPPPGMYENPDSQPSYSHAHPAVHGEEPDESLPRQSGPTILRWALIAAGGLVAVVVAGTLLFGFAFFAGPSVSPDESGTRPGGTPAPPQSQHQQPEPEAPSPPPVYRCGADCYSVMDAAALAPKTGGTGELAGLELQDTGKSAASAGLVYDGDQKEWLKSGAAPDECSFALSSGAVWVESASDDEARNDFLIDFGTYADAGGQRRLTQGVRVFDSTPAALQYVGTLESAAAACPSYSTPAGTTMLMPADPAPYQGDLSGTGWFEISDGTETLTVVMQRENIVVATRFSSPA